MGTEPNACISILCRYPRIGASSRLRTIQYVPWLQSYGFKVQVSSFFDEEYIKKLYVGRKTYNLFDPYLKRAQTLLRSDRKNILWVEKECFPWLPWFLERNMINKYTTIVTDYDDAVFHRYDLNHSAIIRASLGRKIDSIMRRSNLVLAGNHYLAERAIRAGSPRVEIVPTVVNAEAYQPKASSRMDGRLCVGWIGSPSTWQEYLRPYAPMLSEIVREHEAVFSVIGSGHKGTEFECFEFLDWNEEEEVDRINNMDIGIMPLEDSPWSRGKCGYKIIQYMACGVPVVASPVGANNSIVEHGVDGFLARSKEEWKGYLSLLMNDADLRRKMGRAGRAKVENSYSIQKYGPIVSGLIAEVAQGGRA
jgi:glycosyltransferase involved in cell wall biosynthesis